MYALDSLGRRRGRDRWVFLRSGDSHTESHLERPKAASSGWWVRIACDEGIFWLKLHTCFININLEVVSWIKNAHVYEVKYNVS